MTFRSVLVYTDAVQYGGHEAMTLQGIQALASVKDTAVSVMYYQGNAELAKRLEGLRDGAENLRLLPMNFRPKRLQVLRSLVSPKAIRRIQTVFKGVGPEVVLVSQGRIESGSVGLLAAKRAGLRTISYIPMAHPVSVSAGPAAARLRDAVNRYFYRLPDKFITISEGARRMLLESGTSTDIAVVPNCIDRIDMHDTDRQKFRNKHMLLPDDYVVAVVGRIDFRQKGQDFALRSILQFRGELEHYKFLFIGEGPDEGKLRKMISVAGLEKRAFVLPWSPNKGEIYCGIDMLLIPSKYEGVPLVMLEAMLCGVRIVASNVDGMAECLPADWLFPYGDARALASALVRVRKQDATKVLEEHRALAAREYTRERFGTSFASEVLA